ncbi:MAG: hypothetical protein ACJ74G_19890 [Blastocatellia bacterium]
MVTEAGWRDDFMTIVRSGDALSDQRAAKGGASFVLLAPPAVINVWCRRHAARSRAAMGRPAGRGGLPR